MPRTPLLAAPVALSLSLLAGCAPSVAAPPSGGLPPAVTKASVTLQALKDSGVAGQLTFTRTPTGVDLVGTITKLAPGSVHGFHIHEKGDCSAPDGSSAGGHFNPGGHVHGGVESPASHVGDLGNATADATGTATIRLFKAGATLGDGGPADILGRGVILHASPDDLKTQPTGASGARIACGVIKP